jgi:uncharacterized membrane protein YbhN (UPF0104 family)
MKKHIKALLAVGILALTVGAFVYYISGHPEVIDQIKTMPRGTLVLLMFLYAIWFLALVGITRVSLRMYNKHMGKQENLLFNAYSSLINFFGPGQSGPIFRAAYLKKRHNLGIKQFLLTTLLYYGFYAVISACFMFIGTRPWWQTLLLMTAVGAVSFVLIRWYAQKKAKVHDEPGFNPFNIGLLFGLTLLQLSTQAVIFGVELASVDAGASVGQVLAYTGVANFALFVALTPGAIGIREGFLLFSQSLHGLSSATVVAASLVDRAAYLVFLGLLFVMTLSMHAKDKLQVKKIESEMEAIKQKAA